MALSRPQCPGAARVMSVLVRLGLVLLTLFFMVMMIGSVVDAATDVADLWGLAIAIPGLVAVPWLWLAANRRFR
jgi:hypothetical protein